MEKVHLVMTLAGVSEEVAARALIDHETPEDAIDALLQKPVVAGDKYVAPKPVVNTGLDPEQEERCRKGRWLQDKVNAVYSVAHSKTLAQPDPSAAEAGVPALPAAADEQSAAVPVLSPGSPLQMSLRTEQS